MTVAAIIGTPDQVDSYHAGPEGRATTRELAATVWGDPDRLAEFELGGDLGIPAPVAAELDRLIERRNAKGGN